MNILNFSDWSLESGVEPVIRIGVVLPEDAMREVSITIPPQAYTVSTNDTEKAPLQSTEAVVAVEGNRVRLSSDAFTSDAAAEWVLSPTQPLPLERGAGVRLHDVITGRGFHWQKRISPTVGATLVFRAVDGHLLVANHVPLEDYLAGAIATEMSGDCPLEFLKSQCLVARSWVLACTEDKHPGLGIDRCNDDCCQRYQGTMDLAGPSLEAMRSTRGQVLLGSDGVIIDANYSKCCGGIIESPQHVWFIDKVGQRSAIDAPPGSQVASFFPLGDGQVDEYLTGDWLADTDIFCSPNVVPPGDLPKYLGKVDDAGDYFRWRVEYDREQLEDILSRKFFSKQHDIAAMHTLIDLRVTRRGDSGRASEMEIEYIDAKGATRRAIVRSEYNIRDALHEKFLYSSAIRIDIERDTSGQPEHITLIGAGWGHGAGLCQIGALGMSLRGYDYTSIATHYFADVTIHTCY